MVAMQEMMVTQQIQRMESEQRDDEHRRKMQRAPVIFEAPTMQQHSQLQIENRHEQHQQHAIQFKPTNAPVYSHSVRGTPSTTTATSTSPQQHYHPQQQVYTLPRPHQEHSHSVTVHAPSSVGNTHLPYPRLREQDVVVPDLQHGTYDYPTRTIDPVSCETSRTQQLQEETHAMLRK